MTRKFHFMFALLASALAANAQNTAPWQWRNPLPQGNSLAGITYANGTFIAVGGTGTILTSTDGAHWTGQKSTTEGSLAGVSYANGISVTVGGSYANPIILNSPDTKSWTNVTPTGSTAQLDGVGYGNGTWVAVGAGCILTSTDGQQWNSYGQIVPNYGTYNAVAYGNNTFVSVGDGGDVMESTSPATWWSAVSAVTSQDLHAVIYGESLFVAVGGYGTVLTSSSGNQWGAQTTGTSVTLYGVAYGNNTFVAVGGSGTILSSSDGTNWTDRSIGGNLDLHAVAYGGGQFIAVGDAGIIVTSPDGTHWTRSDSGNRNPLNAATYGFGIFVSVGDSGAIWTSPDGVQWSTQNSGVTNNLLGVTAGPDCFVAVGAAGTILSSTDGTNWTPHTSGVAGNINGVAYGNGAYVAVGSYIPSLSSPDGSHWSQSAAEDYLDLLAITYGNGKFVAVGDEYQQLNVGMTGYGPIVSSQDGQNWQFSATGYSLYGVTCGNGMYVAVGDAGVWASSDGSDWTNEPSASAGDAAAFGNGEFITVSGNDQLSLSTDGITWTNIPSGTSWGLNGVVYGDGTFVAVGAEGVILQSPYLLGSATSDIGLMGDLSFGNVNLGASAQATLTITNSGNNALNVTSISYPVGFQGDWTAGTIPAGASQTVNIAFSPTVAVAYGGYITVNSDANMGNSSISASGNGVGTNAQTWVPVGPALTYGQLPGGGQWRPVSGRVVGIAPDPTDPNTIYLATAGGGVWKTTDGGANWVPLTDSQITTTMGAIAVAPSNPNVIYAGTGEETGDYMPNRGLGEFFYGHGILRSTDAGATWTLEGQSQFDRHTATRIVVDPTDPNIVYAAIAPGELNGLTGNAGIWKSTNGGTNWVNSTANISTTDTFSDLVMDPSNPQVLYAAIGSPAGAVANGIYKTTDGGASWSRAGNFPAGMELGNIKMAVSASSPQVLYASIAASTVLTNLANFQEFPVCAGLYAMLKSTDGGSTWTQLTNVPNYLIAQGQFNSTLAVDPSDSNIVFAGGTALGWGQPSGMMVSLDGGNSWYALDAGWTDGEAIHGDCHALAFDAAGELLLGDDGGIWRLDPNTVDWQDLNNGLNTLQLDGVALNPTNAAILYEGVQDNGTVKCEDNPQGAQLLAGDGGYVFVSSNQPGTVYTEQYGLSIQRSDDGGATWATKLTGVGYDNSYFFVPYVLDQAHPGRLVMGTDRIYESLDWGDNWTGLSAPQTGGWTTNEVITAVAVAATETNTIYAAAGGNIYATFNDGSTWEERDINGTPAGWIQGMAVDPANNQTAYVVRAIIGGGRVYYTTDGGLNWTNISGNLPDLPVYCIGIDPRTDPHTLYIGTHSGVYMSQNVGQNWSLVGEGLPNAIVSTVEVDTGLNVLAVATYGRGAWEIPLSSTVNTPPRLSIVSEPNHALTLMWPGTATGFVLETADELAPSPNWTVVTNIGSLQNGEYQITLPATGSGQFFRLVQPQ